MSASQGLGTVEESGNTARMIECLGKAGQGHLGGGGRGGGQGGSGPGAGLTRTVKRKGPRGFVGSPHKAADKS